MIGSLALNNLHRGIFGDLVIGAMGGYPTIPDAPPKPFVSPQIAQSESIAGNQAALPSLENLGRDVNAYNLTERSKALNKGIFDYGPLTLANTSLLEDQLAGRIPDDVAAQVQRRSNSRAYAGGYGGSPAADNLFARDLGLTSLDIQGRGQANLPGWLSLMNNIAVPPQFDVQGSFISPAQQIATSQWNEENRFNRDWLQNQLDSIPDPETAAIAKDVGQITDLVAAAALAWAGGAIGGVAGGAAGSAAGSQLGGAIGGGGGSGGQGSQIGQLIGGLMSSSGTTGGGSQFTPSNFGPGATYGYVPNQQVSPYGSGATSLYGTGSQYPGAIGGYEFGAAYGGF